MNQNIKIAVIGGTGKAGKYLLKELINQGFIIRALVRNPRKLVENGSIEMVAGDVLNYDTVYNLINGCNVVISTLGQTKGEDPIFSLATKNIVSAMEALQIKRYIVLTGLTLDIASDKKGFSTRMRSLAMKLLFRSTILDKKEEYKILNGTNLDWTIVRVPFIEISDERKAVEVSLLDCYGSRISSTSLAAFITDQINEHKYFRKAPFLWDL